MVRSRGAAGDAVSAPVMDGKTYKRVGGELAHPLSPSRRTPSRARTPAGRQWRIGSLLFAAEQGFRVTVEHIRECPDGPDRLLQGLEGVGEVVVEHGIRARQGLLGLFQRG